MTKVSGVRYESKRDVMGGRSVVATDVNKTYRWNGLFINFVTFACLQIGHTIQRSMELVPYCQSVHSHLVHINYYKLCPSARPSESLSVPRHGLHMTFTGKIATNDCNLMVRLLKSLFMMIILCGTIESRYGERVGLTHNFPIRVCNWCK